MYPLKGRDIALKWQWVFNVGNLPMQMELNWNSRYAVVLKKR